jgi:alpha-methylacyl-CoA racemase
VGDDPAFDAQHDRLAWPDLKAKLAAIIARKTRDEWDAIMAATDICYAPVLGMAEAPSHPHNVARQTFAEVGGAIQPMPAPRYSATPNDTPRPAPRVDTDSAAILGELGFATDFLEA